MRLQLLFCILLIGICLGLPCNDQNQCLTSDKTCQYQSCTKCPDRSLRSQYRCIGESCQDDYNCGSYTCVDSVCSACDNDVVGQWCSGHECKLDSECKTGFCSSNSILEYGICSTCSDGIKQPFIGNRCNGVSCNVYSVECATDFCENSVCVPCKIDSPTDKCNYRPCVNNTECKSGTCNKGKCDHCYAEQTARGGRFQCNGGACEGDNECSSTKCVKGLCVQSCTEDSHCPIVCNNSVCGEVLPENNPSHVAEIIGIVIGALAFIFLVWCFCKYCKDLPSKSVPVYRQQTVPYQRPVSVQSEYEDELIGHAVVPIYERRKVNRY